MSCKPCTGADDPPKKRRIVGFRAWYYIDDKIREFRGETFNDWHAMPNDGFQAANLYENWCAGPGYRYQRALSGHKRYFCAPDPGGLVFGRESVDSVAQILKRYPGASIKRGKEAPLEIFAEIERLAGAATDL